MFFTSSYRRWYSLHVVRDYGESGVPTERRRRMYSDTYFHVLLCRQNGAFMEEKELECRWHGHSHVSVVATWTHVWAWGTKDLQVKFKGEFLWGNFMEGMQWGPGELELHSPCLTRHPGGLQFQKHRRQLSWARLLDEHGEPRSRALEGSAIGMASGWGKASRKRMPLQRFHTDSRVNRCKTVLRTGRHNCETS